MEPLKISRKQAKPVLEHSFPHYRGHKVRVEFTERVTFHDTNWCGGTRSEYHAVRADGRDARLVVDAPWVNAVEGKTVVLPADVLIVRHSFFCGQDSGITIFAHPNHAPKWLCD